MLKAQMCRRQAARNTGTTNGHKLGSHVNRSQSQVQKDHRAEDKLSRARKRKSHGPETNCQTIGCSASKQVIEMGGWGGWGGREREIASMGK